MKKITPASPSTEAIERIQKLTELLTIKAVLTDIEMHTRELYPSAIGVTFSRDSFGKWGFRNVIGEAGLLSAEAGKYNDDNPAIYELDDRVNPLLVKHFGHSEQPLYVSTIHSDFKYYFRKPGTFDADVRHAQMADIVSHIRSITDELETLEAETESTKTS
jgi:hypothetical protein